MPCPRRFRVGEFGVATGAGLVLSVINAHGSEVSAGAATMRWRMNTLTKEVLGEMTEAVVREVDPERIILFGSHARDEQRADSDIDLLIVEKEAFGPIRNRRREIARVRRVLSRFRFPKDILVYSVAEVEKWQDTANHIVARSLREGQVLYERS
jgi:predicted nucleotidyltransferase